jgi:hypothetical protein
MNKSPTRAASALAEESSALVPVAAASLLPEAIRGLRAQVTDVAAQAQHFAVIRSRQQLEEAGVVLVDGVRALERRIHKKIDPIIKLQSDALDGMRALLAEMLAPVFAAKAVLDAGIKDYYARAEAARERLALKDAQQAERTGAPPSAPPPEPPKIEGVSVRRHWTFEVLRADSLQRAYLKPDEQKIRGVVAALGPEAVHAVTSAPAGPPAIRVWRDDRVASSRRGGAA